MKYALALLFVLVQVLGEQFQVELLPFGLTQTFWILVLAATALNARAGSARFNGSIDRSLLVFALLLVLALAFGWRRGEHWSNMRDDLSPFFFLVTSYVVTRLIVRSASSLRTVIGGILIGSGLAAFKVMYIAMGSTTVEWNGPWQAVYSEDFGTLRVILLGADLFFVVSTIMVLAQWLANRTMDRWKMAVGILALVSVFASGTRSNWIGLGSGLSVVAFTAGYFSIIRWKRIILGGAIGVILLATVFVLSNSLQTIVARSQESTMTRIEPITVRMYESEGVLTSIGGVILGNGLGSSYNYYSMYSKKMVTEQFSHNGYLMLYLKTGILGLLLFLIVVYRVMQTAFRLAGTGHPLREELIGIIGGLVALLVISIGANKIFALSGNMFMGWAFAIVQAAEASGGALGNRRPTRVSRHVRGHLKNYQRQGQLKMFRPK